MSTCLRVTVTVSAALTVGLLALAPLGPWPAAASSTVLSLGAALVAAVAALLSLLVLARVTRLLRSLPAPDPLLAARLLAGLPVPRIVVQPIVDLRTGRVVAEEALSRFEAGDPATVFHQAALDGRGPELEIAALGAALGAVLQPERSDRRLSLNVTLDTLVTAGGHRVLPEDLSGVILEITEHGDVDDVPGTEELLVSLRDRGCTIAIDDWGRGHSNLSRMLSLRPELIKLDMSLVHGLGSPYLRELVTAMVRWSEQVGVTVCAEGIETTAQRDELVRLGVHLGQGYLFGRPARPLRPGVLVPAPVVA